MIIINILLIINIITLPAIIIQLNDHHQYLHHQHHHPHIPHHHIQLHEQYRPHITAWLHN